MTVVLRLLFNDSYEVDPETNMSPDRFRNLEHQFLGGGFKDAVDGRKPVPPAMYNTL